MNIRLHDGPLDELDCDAVFVPLVGGATLGQKAETLVSSLRQSGEITGKQGELTILHEPNDLAASRLILMGVGNAFDADQAFCMAGQAIRAAQKRKFKRLVFAFNDGDLVRAVTEGCVYGGYERPKYKSDDTSSA
ncbi:MAG: M17 family peptidase N-terminal domain-containing protein, partial [Verrucomicrobiota bacterium]|nr:M17 family peptidase N-terminal domain-containing protein [Verrucomicrobiota bacterium]